MARATNVQPIIIRKFEEAGHDGHHGGAWKVAYADFMTAMMAFFLLMWIMSNASKDQLNGISNYFTPANVSMTARGGIGALGGTAVGPKGILSASNGDARPLAADTQAPTEKVSEPVATPAKKVTPPADTPAPADAQQPAKVVTVVKEVPEHALDEQRFKQVQAEIEKTIQSDPQLKPLMQNVQFRQTPEGLQIEVVDQAGRALFASGSAKVEGATLLLMQKLAKVVATLPNRIRIAGHTDSVPFAEGSGRDNWDLSSERANATRRIFVGSGVESDRITRISGLADTDPLKPEDPRDPSNRRISVLLAYQQGQSAAALQGASEAATAAGAGVTVEQAPATPQDAPAASPDGTAGTVHADAAPADPIARQYSLITPQDLARRP